MNSPYPTTTYTYDDAGNLSTMAQANGEVTTYGYDQDNRLYSMTVRNGANYVADYLSAGAVLYGDGEF